VVISTRHASHAALVIQALEAGKHVYVEKPMATTTRDCLRIIRAQQRSGRLLRVGFNRRFAPFLLAMKQAVGTGKKLFNIRVNVGAIGQHWSNSTQEGGRLLGEGVHFFDLANWMIASQPETVCSQFLGEADALNPDAIISIGYADGSVANISYVTQGHTGRGKEFFELFSNGRSLVMDDYKTLSGYGCRVRASRRGRDNKGQFEAMQEFVRAALQEQEQGGADAEAGLLATAICEAAIISGQTGRRVRLSDFIQQHQPQNDSLLTESPATDKRDN
jgi:predicted dehydrogenase